LHAVRIPVMPIADSRLTTPPRPARHFSLAARASRAVSINDTSNQTGPASVLALLARPFETVQQMCLKRDCCVETRLIALADVRAR
jgi:hypothetical protein